MRRSRVKIVSLMEHYFVASRCTGIYKSLLANGLELYFFWIILIVVIIYIVKFDVKQAIVMNVAMLLMTMIIAGPVSTSTFMFRISYCRNCLRSRFNKGKVQLI